MLPFDDVLQGESQHVANHLLHIDVQFTSTPTCPHAHTHCHILGSLESAQPFQLFTVHILLTYTQTHHITLSPLFRRSLESAQRGPSPAPAPRVYAAVGQAQTQARLRALGRFWLHLLVRRLTEACAGHPAVHPAAGKRIKR